MQPSFLSLPIKFTPADIITGAADKPGDQFTAFFFTGEQTFTVLSEHFNPSCFYAERSA